jgi:hypothetical protein
MSFDHLALATIPSKNCRVSAVDGSCSYKVYPFGDEPSPFQTPFCSKQSKIPWHWYIPDYNKIAKSVGASSVFLIQFCQTKLSLGIGCFVILHRQHS